MLNQVRRGASSGGFKRGKKKKRSLIGWELTHEVEMHALLLPTAVVQAIW